MLWPVPPTVQLALLPAGFYAGFLLAAWAVVRFTRGVMDREMALERRVPWFVGAALVITYLEVFTWVHGSLRLLPRPTTYAPLVILILSVLLGRLGFAAALMPRYGTDILWWSFPLGSAISYAIAGSNSWSRCH